MVTYTVVTPVALAALGYAFTYFLIYRKQKFIGNIFFLGVSFAFWAGVAEGTSLTVPNMQNAIGFILTIGSLTKLIYELVWG